VNARIGQPARVVKRIGGAEIAPAESSLRRQQSGGADPPHTTPHRPENTDGENYPRKSPTRP